MRYRIERTDGIVTVESTGAGRHRIEVQPSCGGAYVPIRACETGYPLPLIEKILGVKGAAWLCDEILRDEDSAVVEKNLRTDVFPYVPRPDFAGRRILDFGCGSGSSTAVLARLLPATQIVGVELQPELVDIARLRAAHHGFSDRVQFLVSPSGDALPAGLGAFDHVFLNAVFEHLLPHERATVLPMLWRQLQPGGVLFVTETPYRWFPVEYHTTGGLALLNYLPDPWALRLARRFSPRGLQGQDWPSLLRDGIRGGSPGEILRLLADGASRATVLEPRQAGLTDRVDLWYAALDKTRRMALKKALFGAFKLIRLGTGVTMLPTLCLAIRKEGR
jgi:2-polyprenyl-3-methyl-5-hydroxy-6-metoxy-1,4-benzoquinol methylase